MAIELDNILSTDIEKARASIQRLSEKIGINLVELPINIDRSDSPTALAYTNSEGIWISKKIIIQEPDAVEIYLAHEIFHHVVNDHENTSKFSAMDVNIAEDYSINWHIKRLFGYDVRKLKSGKFLYNEKLGCMRVHKILKYKMKESSRGCCSFGIPHVTILEAARKIRSEYEPWKSMVHTRPLFFLDDMDRQKYLSVLDAVRYKIPATTLPIDIRQVLEGLWTHAFYEAPVAKLRHDLTLTNTETVAYAWRRDFNTSGDAIVSAYSAAKFINILSEHKAYLEMRVGSAMTRHARIAGKLKAAQEIGAKKTAKKLQRKLASAALAVQRAKNRLEWPIERLFKEKPVTRIPAIEIPVRAAALRVPDKRKPIAGLPTLRRNETVRELRLLSGVSQRIVQKVKNIVDALEDIFDADAPGTPDMHLPKTENSGGNESQGNKSAAQQKIDQLETVESNANLLIDIIQYMREFETALAKKRNRNSSDSQYVNQLISYGNELEQVELAEFALLASTPDVQSVFYNKLSNHSLMLYTPPEMKRSPIVIAVDCSGSMSGEYYVTACGFALAMIKMLAQDKRGAALYTFSDDVGKSVVSNGKEISMQQCLDVLTNIRSGGTSFSAALAGAYNIKNNMGWKSLTTIMITDGQSNLNPDIKDRLRTEKSPDDKLIAVLTSGNDDGLYPFCDDSVRVKRSKLFNELIEQGGQLL